MFIIFYEVYYNINKASHSSAISKNDCDIFKPYLLFLHTDRNILHGGDGL